MHGGYIALLLYPISRYFFRWGLHKFFKTGSVLRYSTSALNSYDYRPVTFLYKHSFSQILQF